jgi:hypothetical protein
MVKSQFRPCRSLPIPSLGRGWQHGCSCRGLPSPVVIVGSVRWYCCMSYNSRRRQPTVTQVNLSHTSFTVGRYFTVKEVRLHSSRGGWNSCRHALPRYGGQNECHVECTTIVCGKPGSEMGARVRRCLSLRGVGRRVRGQGVGRAGACAWSQGVGRDGACARALVISGDLPYLLFAIFISLIWVSLFMVPNTYIREIYVKLFTNFMRNYILSPSCNIVHFSIQNLSSNIMHSREQNSILH